MAIIKVIPMPGPSGLNGGDLSVPLHIKDSNGDNFISFTKTGTGTARIGTPQDDLSLRSARDITLFAGDDGPGNVYIGWGDAVYTPDSPNRVATIGDVTSANTGDITFDGNTIFGAGTASGDGYGNGTINLVPDADIETNQYIVIDPTSPNHIHIRAGGTQDASTAELILGGEQANVKVTDYNHQVSIQTYNSESDSSYYWSFQNDGILSGPGMGNVIVPGISGTVDNDLNLFADWDIKLYTGQAYNVPIGYRYTPQRIITTTGNVTSAISDMGFQIYNKSGGGATYIVPLSGTTNFPVGTEIKFANDGDSYWNFDREDETIDLIAEGQSYTNSNIVFWLPSNGFATLVKVDSNRWLLSGLRVND